MSFGSHGLTVPSIGGFDLDLSVGGDDHLSDLRVECCNPTNSQAYEISGPPVSHELNVALPSVTVAGNGIDPKGNNYKRQWVTVNKKPVEFTVHCTARRARIQLRNPKKADIPRDYRILLNVVDMGDQVSAPGVWGVIENVLRWTSLTSTPAFPIRVVPDINTSFVLSGENVWRRYRAAGHVKRKLRVDVKPVRISGSNNQGLIADLKPKVLGLPDAWTAVFRAS